MVSLNTNFIIVNVGLKLPMLQNSPKIAIYTICKNEISFIDRLYSSILQADFISILDTGSTDGTFERLIQLTQSHSQRFNLESKFKVGTIDGKPVQASNGIMCVTRGTILPWRFDDAKNTALSLIPETIDVCISVDADEYLAAGWYESLTNAIKCDINETGSPADRYHHKFSTIWNWKDVNNGAKPDTSDHWHERIHRRNGYRWKLPVHEILIKDGPETVKWLNNVKMIQKPDSNKDRRFYFELLQQSIKEDPNVWKTWSFYADELERRGVSLDIVIQHLEHAKTIKDANIAYLCYRQYLIYDKIGDIDNSIKYLKQAAQIANIREYYVKLCNLYRRHNKQPEALIAILEADKIKTITQGYEYDPTCWGDSFKQLIDEVI